MSGLFFADAAVALVDCGLHDVDDDSGDGDVEPDGEGVSGKAFMCGEASGEREKKSNEDERECDDGEEDVGEQELPVEGPPGTEAVEVGFAVEGEVGEIGDEEDGGEEEGREHCGAMELDVPFSDVAIALDEGKGGEAVEYGVEQGQGTELGSGDVGRGVEVDEVADEGTGQGGGDDDSADDGGRGAEGSGGWERIWH